MPARRKEQVEHTILATYPDWLFEVLDAALKGESYSRIFPAKNYAVNAMHRYHRFRQDVIALGLPGSKNLTEMPASFANPEKTEVMWVFLGQIKHVVLDNTLPVANSAERNNWITKQANAGQEKDEFTKVMEKYYPGIGRMNEKGEEPKAELPTSADEPRIPDVPLDIPALDLDPKGPELPPCPPHEPDAMGNFCIKCKLPWEEQWGVTK